MTVNDKEQTRAAKQSNLFRMTTCISGLTLEAAGQEVEDIFPLVD